MDFKTFLKILARLSGSLLLSTGIFLIIFAFISSNVVNNIEKVHIQITVIFSFTR